MSHLPDDIATELRRDAARRETHARPDDVEFPCGAPAYEPLTVAAPGEWPTCAACGWWLQHRERLAARMAACGDRGPISDLALGATGAA